MTTSIPKIVSPSLRLSASLSDCRFQARGAQVQVDGVENMGTRPSTQVNLKSAQAINQLRLEGTPSQARDVHGSLAVCGRPVQSGWSDGVHELRRGSVRLHSRTHHRVLRLYRIMHGRLCMRRWVRERDCQCRQRRHRGLRHPGPCLGQVGPEEGPGGVRQEGHFPHQPRALPER